MNQSPYPRKTAPEPEDGDPGLVASLGFAGCLSLPLLLVLGAAGTTGGAIAIVFVLILAILGAILFRRFRLRRLELRRLADLQRRLAFPQHVADQPEASLTSSTHPLSSPNLDEA